MRAFWLILGLLMLGIGAIGLVLPIMPTVPFVIIAGYCFTKSSDKLHQWMLDNKYTGPTLHAWEEHGALPHSTKVIGVISMALSVVIAILLKLPTSGIIIQAIVLFGASVWVWTRPDA